MTRTESPRSTASWRSLLGAVPALLVRPDLWLTALRQVFVLARRSWWRRPPFLPVPDPAYLHFRLVTAYGDRGRPPEPRDVVTYLVWCRDERRRNRGAALGGRG